MNRWIKTAGWMMVAVAAALAPSAAQAQFYQVYSPPQPVVLPAVSYYAPPVTTYYAPPVTSFYAPPVTSFYAPPVTSYYAPPVTVYSQPYVAYSPGVVTTRTYAGLGIFRPRGVYTETYVAPVAPRTSYYVPWYLR